jgi:RNA-directed DNA polymerase
MSENGQSQLPEQAGQTGKAGQAQADGRVLRSSADPPETKTCGEQRGGTCLNASQRSDGRGDGEEEGAYLFDSITTPPKVRKLQRTLYRKAKANRKYRFYSLYGEVCRRDVLEAAMCAVSANDGGPGIDGVCIQELAKDDTKWTQWLEALEAELKAKAYKPSPVLRKYIPKGDGKMRPLGIPTVKDRVVQAAVMIVLVGIYEADFHSRSYAYRPKHSAHQAMHEIRKGMLSGRNEVIDADLSGYFDSIPHRELMELVSRRISDGSILELIKAWLKAPIVEEDPKTKRRKITPNDKGTPQGGVISPLLANLYLDGLDRGVNDRCELKPWMIRYADDFVILCGKGQGQRLLERLNKWLEARKLKLNEKKTRLLDGRKETFKFLGFGVGWRRDRKGRRYVHMEPHAKSRTKLREKLREKLNHWTLDQAPEEVIPQLNRMLKGWAGYFRLGHYQKTFWSMEHYVQNRVRRWLWRRHKCTKALFGYYTDEVLHEQYGLSYLIPRKPKATR